MGGQLGNGWSVAYFCLLTKVFQPPARCPSGPNVSPFPSCSDFALLTRAMPFGALLGSDVQDYLRLRHRLAVNTTSRMVEKRCTLGSVRECPGWKRCSTGEIQQGARNVDSVSPGSTPFCHG